MKKTVSICILSIILAGLVLGIVLLFRQPQEPEQFEHIAASTEMLFDTEVVAESTELLWESMSIQKNYAYLIKEEDGRLIVYYGDGETVYLVSDIRLEDLDSEMQKKVAAGITFENARELFEFLENYSS